eukprot:NODE_534_length_1836_cov_8.582212_g526_i0.p1 GENE.NODE_534_length_1836_cov_8.582212_g526_i0~~NODE_534_length_1836_cov_8.582212_g526_i0.p1  ORF type:complete len:497 (-),score=101.96 NODE_534_length_1836_cov_8.582212_g526_i0:9-1499(-)
MDYLLLLKAEQGVQIHMLLWDETNAAVTNLSAENMAYLQGLHPNIRVIRHPLVQPLLWAHHQKTIVADSSVAIVGGFDVSVGRWDTPEHVLTDPTGKWWHGGDYYNPHKARPAGIDMSIDDIDRQQVPRMPWHDVSVRVTGKAALDVANNFVARWNHHKDADVLALRVGFQTDTAVGGTQNATIVRSLDKWSGGDGLECSILGEYLRVIAEAEHYVYIENQYISSSLAGGGVKNRVFSVLLEKLSEMIRAGKVFRVFIVCTQPEEVGDTYVNLLRWQYQTLSRGGTSLVEALRERFPTAPVRQYVAVVWLRSYAFLRNTLVCEKVFVHSKLLLVDDRVAIIASANLNDRSLLGVRDSELGVVVTDDARVEIPMNGVGVMVGQWVHELRLKLWHEHLGVASCPVSPVRDPVAPEVYQRYWIDIPTRNAAIYQEVFPEVPNDSMRTWAQMDKATAPPLRAAHLLTGIVGHATAYPLDFLVEHDMRPLVRVVVGNEAYQ